MLLQLVGAAAMLVGGTWALGPWFLLVAGVVLLVVPELLERPDDVAEGEAPAGPRSVLPSPGVPERVSRRERRRRAA